MPYYASTNPLVVGAMFSFANGNYSGGLDWIGASVPAIASGGPGATGQGQSVRIRPDGTASSVGEVTAATTSLGVVTDVKLNTAGNGLYVKQGANATHGVSTLVGGTVVVSTTKVTANSNIFLTCNTQGGTPGFLRVSARTASTSFTILSSSGTDTSVVGWLIVEPA